MSIAARRISLVGLAALLPLTTAMPAGADDDKRPVPAEITLTSGRTIVNKNGIVRLQSYVARIDWSDTRHGMAILGMGGEGSPPSELLPHVDRLRALVEYLSPTSGRDLQRAPGEFESVGSDGARSPFVTAGLAFVRLLDDETDTPLRIEPDQGLTLTIRLPDALLDPVTGRPLAEGDAIEILVLEEETGRWREHAVDRLEASESGLRSRIALERSGWYMLGWSMTPCAGTVVVPAIDTCGNPLRSAELVLSAIRTPERVSPHQASQTLPPEAPTGTPGRRLFAPGFNRVLRSRDGSFDLSGIPAGTSLQGFLRQPDSGPAVETDIGSIRIDDCRLETPEDGALISLGITDTSRGVYVWPGSGRRNRDPRQDGILTSFGPRIHRGSSEHHRGIDLPDQDCLRKGCTTFAKPVHAVYEGTVCCADPGDRPCEIEGEALYFESPHVVIRSHDPLRDQDLFQVYTHLDRLDVAAGDLVKRGLEIGTVGDTGDESSDPHLHFELREGSPRPFAAAHPFRYLKYTDTENFSTFKLDGLSGVGGGRRARLRFHAPDSQEGDLLGVEIEFVGAAVDGSRGTLEHHSRRVDLEDEAALPRTAGDQCRFRDGIVLEGYQTSDMQNGRWRDLRYGILLEEIPAAATGVVATVIDVAGNRTKAGPLLLPQGRHDEGPEVDLSSISTIETPWALSSPGTFVALGPGLGRDGAPGLRARDDSSARVFQHAGLVRDLPSPAFDLTLEGDFRFGSLQPADAVAHPLYLRNADERKLVLSVFGRNEPDGIRAGLSWRATGGGEPQQRTGRRWSSLLPESIWRRWRLHLVRLGTRTATARLFVGDMAVEQVRTTWSSAQLPPQQLRAGLGLTAEGATAESWVSGLTLTTDGSVGPSSCAEPNTPRGRGVRVTLSDPAAPDLAVDLTAGRVHRTGWTSVVRLAVGPDPPTGGRSAAAPFDRPFEIATTAIIPTSADLQICVPADLTDPTTGGLSILQFADDESEIAGWKDLGAEQRNGHWCAVTRSLSPFALRIG